MPHKMYFMTSPAVTIRSAVGLLLFISSVNAAFHPPRAIAAKNTETEKGIRHFVNGTYVYKICLTALIVYLLTLEFDH